MRQVRNLLLSLASLALLFALLEAGWRVYEGFGGAADGEGELPRHRRCGDCGYVYEPNPERPDVSAQALRDRPFAVPKPAGVFRILVLGDSVAGGFRIPQPRSFPKELERRLSRGGRRVEVVNASANGWTAYNELHYYLERGRDFDPDLVLVALCLNDVVDPALHWEALGGRPDEIPPPSIPNPRYHEERVVPRLRLLLLADGPSRLLRSLLLRLHDHWHFRRLAREGWRDVDGVRRPVFLTYEDTLPIDVWLDYDSPEWRWLRRLYDRLAAAVRADGAEVAVVVLPLAYQLEADYPFRPQQQIERFCRDRSLLCIDALPALRRHAPGDVFLLEQAGFYDVWHMTPAGHRQVARLVEERLVGEGLVPAPGRQ